MQFIIKQLSAQISIMLLVGTFLVGGIARVSTAADVALTISADHQFDFAQRYFDTHDYARAIDEFQRFIHFFPQDKRIPEAHWLIAMSHLQNKDHAQAIKAFRAIIDDPNGNEINTQAWFMLAQSYLEARAPGQAAAALQNLLSLTNDPDITDKAHYRLGWIYVETGAFRKAQHHFDQVSERNRARYRLEDLSDALEDEKQIQYKNPRLAGTLALLPGAGHLYCNRKQDALIAFVLNGGLILAAHEAFDNDLPVLGSLITLVEVGFYTGNIYSAVNSAHKYNRSQKGQFVEKLKRNLKIGLTGSMNQKSVGFAFKYTF